MPQHACQFVFSVVLGVVSSVAAAQTTYKCGNAYSETPCVDGKAVAVGDKRSDDQKREADGATARAQVMAGKLEKDRLKRESEEALVSQKAGSPATAQKVSRTPLKIFKPKPAKPVKFAKKKKDKAIKLVG